MMKIPYYCDLVLVCIRMVKHKILSIQCLFVVALFTIFHPAFGSSGIHDSTFNTGKGFNSAVWATAVQNDGKIIAVGHFTSFDGIVRNKFARLHADGSLDSGFNSSNLFRVSSEIYTIFIQPDGKILLGGLIRFRKQSVRRTANIIRLNSDGTIDSTFQTGDGFNYTVRAIVMQPDGKLVAGGSFTRFNQTKIRLIARLHKNGALDTSFNSANGFNFNNISVYSILLQPDGKLIIGGAFSSFNRNPRDGIARLHADGTLDTTFQPKKGFNTAVWTLALQADGKVIAGGPFTKFNKMKNWKYLIRLHADGSPDTSFNQDHWSTLIAKNRWYQTEEDNISFVSVVLVQPDNKILVALRANTKGLNGVSFATITRLNADGSLDKTFHRVVLFNNPIYSITVQTDGKIIAGGNFSTMNRNRTNRIIRLNNPIP